MQIDILTIFPSMFVGPFSESIIKRAQAKKSVIINIHDLRTWATDPHHSTDDRPYGGGPGMVMLIEPIDKAVKEIISKSKFPISNRKIIVTAASGDEFTQQKAEAYSRLDHLIIIAGHYEGIYFHRKLRLNRRRITRHGNNRCPDTSHSWSFR
jgi:tRNA (guanine37-N1)-methyltransferase